MLGENFPYASNDNNAANVNNNGNVNPNYHYTNNNVLVRPVASKKLGLYVLRLCK